MFVIYLLCCIIIVTYVFDKSVSCERYFLAFSLELHESVHPIRDCRGDYPNRCSIDVDNQ